MFVAIVQKTHTVFCWAPVTAGRETIAELVLQFSDTRHWTPLFAYNHVWWAQSFLLNCFSPRLLSQVQAGEEKSKLVSRTQTFPLDQWVNLLIISLHGGSLNIIKRQMHFLVNSLLSCCDFWRVRRGCVGCLSTTGEIMGNKEIKEP